LLKKQLLPKMEKVGGQTESAKEKGKAIWPLVREKTRHKALQRKTKRATQAILLAKTAWGGRPKHSPTGA